MSVPDGRAIRTLGYSHQMSPHMGLEDHRGQATLVKGLGLREAVFEPQSRRAHRGVKEKVDPAGAARLSFAELFGGAKSL